MNILFDDPLPFDEALDELRSKRLLPTLLGSAEIREWDAELRRRSLFSAKVNEMRYLQRIQEVVGQMLSGEINIATGRAFLQDELDAMGYEPEPGMEESLQDFSSDLRTKLVLETNVRQVANYGQWKSGQSDFALYAWPCLELIRIYPRTVPRGLKRSKGGVIVPDPDNGWPARWEKAGGSFYGGRMIARKDDDVWNQIGSSELFSDGLDQPYPPFAFNSGFGTIQRKREDCIALGVIAADAEIEGSRGRSMNRNVEIAADFDADFLRELRDSLRAEVRDGKLQLEGAAR